MYFSAAGLNYNLARVHINSCDFAESNYNFDDVPNDFNLEHFDDGLTRDNQALIPLIQRARAMMNLAGREMKLMATPWSPPGWMKTNGQMDESPEVGLRPECRAVWANYISRWISAYTAHGIPIWAITVQNEPGQSSPFDSCQFSAADEADFLAAHLGPTLRADHPELMIFIFDHNKKELWDYASAVLANAAAAQFVNGVAFHWYTGDYFDQVQHVHEAFPDKILIASEATFETRRWAKGMTKPYDDWGFGMGYAHDMIGDFNAGTKGWIDWNLMLDTNGGPNHVGNVCDAAIIGDLEQQVVIPHAQYWFIGQFSKYIVPGSLHLRTEVQNSVQWGESWVRWYGTCTGDDGIEATSFQLPDGQRIVTVVLNCGDDAVDFKIRSGACAIRGHIPARSIKTFRYTPAC